MCKQEENGKQARRIAIDDYMPRLKQVMCDPTQTKPASVAQKPKSGAERKECANTRTERQRGRHTDLI